MGLWTWTLVAVIGVVAEIGFRLLPAAIQVGLKYLMLTAGCFIAIILFLAVARSTLFLIIWLVTGGRHHFWFIPNLTADSGFVDSFRPFYTHEYKGPRISSSRKWLADKTNSRAPEATEVHKLDSEKKLDNEKKT